LQKLRKREPKEMLMRLSSTWKKWKNSRSARLWKRWSTGILCQPPAISSKSYVCVKCVQHILVFMIMTGVWLTTLEANFISAS